MEWKVWYYNINLNKIMQYDIFAHGRFNEYLKKVFQKCKTREEFSKEARRELMYYYWSRAEWEIVIEVDEDGHISLIPWCGCRNPEAARIYVDNDDSFDWEGFAQEQIAKQIYKNSAKIDVFSQVEYMWDEFVDYCWSFRKG